MVKRFASVENEELDNILNNRDSSNTKNVIRLATNVLREYANENSILMEDYQSRTCVKSSEHFMPLYEIKRANSTVNIP